jgi:hypothetical protein
MLPNRRVFAKGLGAALAAPEPARSVNDLLRDVLTVEPLAWDSDEQRLVRALSERIDVASGDEARLLPLARNVLALLDAASSNEAVAMLLEFIADRERVTDVIRKYCDGRLTRLSFLSFVAEQRWPGGVRQRVAALTSADAIALITALEINDVAHLEAVLTS